MLPLFLQFEPYSSCTSLNVELMSRFRSGLSSLQYKKSEDEGNALKVMVWELGMFRDEVVASQAIQIRRRLLSGLPLHYVGPFEFRFQNKGNTPRNILQEIIWHKHVEVSKICVFFAFSFSLLLY